MKRHLLRQVQTLKRKGGCKHKIDWGGREITACKKMLEYNLLSFQHVTERKGSGAVVFACLASHRYVVGEGRDHFF